MTTLSILIPVFNEGPTIQKLLAAVVAAELKSGVEKELIVVDDASTDQTANRVREFKHAHPEVTLHFEQHARNQGKGAALHTAIARATGDYAVVQDADLEYDPREINLLLQPVLEGVADVVFGSRFQGGNQHRVMYFWHSVGNRALTTASNMFTNLNLTDMETCYKLFKLPLLKSLKLEEKRFGFEPEITAKVARIPGVRIYEVGISYFGRSYEEGKKIGWKDGVSALRCIVKYGLLR